MARRTSKVKHLVKLGADRRAFYTCELAHKWSQSNVDKPGSCGFMANFLCSEAVKTGWPRFNVKREHSGPLSRACQCKNKHKPLHLSRAMWKATHATVCAEFLHALPRLPEGKESLNMIKERGNHDSLFSPMTHADSPARFLLKDLLWLAPGGVRGD